MHSKYKLPDCYSGVLDSRAARDDRNNRTHTTTTTTTTTTATTIGLWLLFKVDWIDTWLEQLLLRGKHVSRVWIEDFELFQCRSRWAPR